MRNPNFRLIWLGQWTRATGLWVQLTATPLLILSLGGSAIDLGVVFSLQFMPSLFLGPLGGVLADRLPKRRTLLALQTLTVGQSLLFVAAVATGAATWQVMVLSLFIGLISAAEMPLRMSFVAELVPDEEIPNATALMMVAFNGSRVVGPAAAGLIVASLGFAANFVWSAAAAIVTLALTWRINSVRSRPRPRRTTSTMTMSLVEGVHYAFRTASVSTALAILAAMAIFGASFQTILPVYATEVLHLDERGYGLLVTAMGIGALTAAVPMTLVTFVQARRIMWAAPVAFGAILGVLVVAQAPLISFVGVGALGFFFLLTNSSVNVSIQGTVSHDVRGRTAGIFIAVTKGGTAVGGLVMGLLTEVFGIATAMAIGGLGTAGVAILLRVAFGASWSVAQTRPASRGSDLPTGREIAKW